MEAILQEQFSDHVYFKQERAAETLTYGKMQRVALIKLDLALVTLEWTFAAVGKIVCLTRKLF